MTFRSVVILALGLVGLGYPDFARSGDIEAVGGSVALVSPGEELRDAAGIELQLRFRSRLGSLTPEVWLCHWQTTFEVPYDFQRVSFWAYGFRVKYFFPTSGPLWPYGSASFSLDRVSKSRHFVRFHGGDMSIGYSSHVDWFFGLTFLGGIEVALTPRLSGTAGMGFSIGEVDYFQARLGVQYLL